MTRLTEKSIQQTVEKRRRAPEPDRSASWRMSSLPQSFHAPISHLRRVHSPKDRSTTTRPPRSLTNPTHPRPASPLPRSNQQPPSDVAPAKRRTNKYPFHIACKLSFQPNNIPSQRKLSYANQQPIILSHQNGLRLLQRPSKESCNLHIMIIAVRPKLTPHR